MPLWLQFILNYIYIRVKIYTYMIFYYNIVKKVIIVELNKFERNISKI